MFNAIKPRTYFKVSCVQEMLDDLGIRNERYPNCLSNDDLDNPLEVVFVLSSQTALMIAFSISQVQVSLALEAFYRSLYREVTNLPEYKYSTDGFFQIKTDEELISEIDSYEDNLYDYMKPQKIECPLEIVVAMTPRFAESVLKVLQESKPVDVLLLFCQALQTKLSSLEVK